MFISVDLPAPFSPSNACTSPLRRSKSTWSFASTPGNRFVIPRSSRTGVSVAATVAGDSMKNGRGRARWPALFPVLQRSLTDLGRHLDLACDDLRLDGVDLLHVGRGHARADLA